ncbi:hypothetical protein LOAG_17183 [Loa loa]|uniref:Uncharacterized protein n=1 Tax=Loa loa TaxID=7209 RepID=A0A1S0UJ77_LOALO|nr:hypothetical protein LOAG_17183 [Loa loa]EJD75740.1 hypothetical protein LOAG_17183 [Loa loa]
MKMDDENGFAAIARYERECYEHLFASSHYHLTTLPEQQGFGFPGARGFQKGTGRIGADFDAGTRLGMNAGKHTLSTNFIGPLMIEDQTKIGTSLENSNNNDWPTLLAASNQYYEIWNCAPLLTWNFNFKE